VSDRFRYLMRQLLVVSRELGGREQACEQLQACQLLCRYRNSVHIGAEDIRLRTWLEANHTTEGLCYAGALHGSTCHYAHAAATHRREGNHVVTTQ
jgi:hypothetical protein